MSQGNIKTDFKNSSKQTSFSSTILSYKSTSSQQLEKMRKFAIYPLPHLATVSVVYFLFMNWLIMSMGRGKMMVEFFSAAMVFRVCR